jgi:orotate phosphoribosyltransferase
MTRAPAATATTFSLHRGDPAVVARMLESPGVVLEGHFELLSGLHADRFIAFSRIANQGPALDLISEWIASAAAAHEPDVVLAPSTAGVGLGWTLARRLGRPMHLASLASDGRPAGILGEPTLEGARVLIVNDVVTTGTGIARLAEIVHDRGGEAVAAAWFASRSSSDIEDRIGVPAIYVADIRLPAWDAEACPLCSSSPAVAALDLN